jgi:GNAT superfamily N-acetyltransferase
VPHVSTPSTPRQQAGIGPAQIKASTSNPFHWIGSKLEQGASDVKQIGTGLYGVGKAAVSGLIHPDPNAAAEWDALFHGHPGRSWDLAQKSSIGREVTGADRALTKGQFESLKGVVLHPGRDPFMDALWLAPVSHVVAKGGLAAAGRSALLDEPRMLSEPGRRPVSLFTSKNAGRRLVQAGIDKAVNHALANENPKGILGHEGPVAAFGRSRMGGTLAEIGRARIRFRQAMVATTRIAGRQVDTFAKSLGHTIENPQLTTQALLHALHDNQLPEHEAIFHEQQAAKGVNPEQNTAWANAFNDAAKLNVVHLDPTDRVVIDPAHPLAGPLSKADSALEKIGAYGEEQLVARGLKEPGDLADRNARVSQLVQRGEPLRGPEPQPLKEARRALINTRQKLATAHEREQTWMSKQDEKISDVSTRVGGRSVELGSPHREKIVTLGHQLEAAQQRVTSLEDRYGFSSPERRAAIEQGIKARDQLHGAAHSLFGDAAAEHLQYIEQMARQYARANDVTPHEFYAHHLSSTEAHAALHPAEGDLNEIAAFHGFPAEKTDANLRGKQNPRTQKNGLPKNKTVFTKEGIHFAGAITPDQWLQRVVSVMKTAAERDHGARWYEHFEPLFREEFPPDVADKIIRGFSVSQANASPSSGVASTLAALDRMSKGEEVGSIGSVVADNIEKALKGEHIDSFVAAKLSDFIDALRGENTRTWMGHKSEGGAPAPIDIWGLRDLGYWDKKIESKGRGARLAKAHGVDVGKLTPDSGGSATGARYERAAEKYHEITDHLNAISFDGRSDWKPAQVQALGWAAIQKFYGQVPEDLATAVAKGRTRSQGILARGYVARAVDEAKKPDGGFTLHSDMTPDHPDKGFAVALAPYEQRVPANDFTPKDLQSFVARHRALLERDPSLRVGGWHNPEDGLVYLDLSRVVPTREEAMTLAREHGQLSVFDRGAAAQGDWGNAFPQSGLPAAEADAIKSAARAQAQAPETYRDIVRSVAEKELGRKPTPLDIKYTEDKMHEAAQARPEDPTSKQFLKLYNDSHAELQKRIPQPEELFSREGDLGFRHIDHPDFSRVVAERNGEHAGQITYKPLENGRHEVQMIRVPEHLQRQGIGTALFNEAEKRVGRGNLLHQSNPDLLSPEGDSFAHSFDVRQGLRQPLEGTASGSPHSDYTLQQEGQGRILGSYRPETGAVRLSSEHATPETLMHEALHGVRQSLSPVIEEVARRQYAPGGWTREAEESFVNDMLKAAHGEHVDPTTQRIFNMTSHWIKGRGFVPMTVWEDMRQSHSPMASATGQVVGEAKSPMNTHFATGEATAQGLRRTDVAESVASHWQKMMRFFNTLDHRELAAQHGSDTRLSSDDVLVRVDRRTEAGQKIPTGSLGPVIKEALNVLENKTGLPAPEAEGLSAGVGEALRDVVGHIFPKLGNDPELLRIEHTAERGTAAPAGYKWVPEQVAKLKDLQSAMAGSESNPLGRFADNVNGAITAATVYYKIGHVTTRVMTNAATNLMQGSLRPSEMARSWDIFHELTPDERQEALAYAGTHYYESAPGAQGGTVVGKGMQKGLHIPFTDKALRTKAGIAVMSPQWWAHNVDAPFRFNSISFEARKAGYDGPDGMRQFLQEVRDYNTLDDHKRAEVDGVLRRADREAIAYDRLNHFEKKFLTRAVWFYPWIKGSTVFTANTWLEHPFKAAAIGTLGQQGNEKSTAEFGDMPSYAHGLTEIAGGQNPVVTDLNTFNPFSTAADLIGTPEHIGNLGGMLNPVFGAALGAAEGINPYGAKTPNPIWDNVKGLAASAPEYQIAASALDHADQSHRLYPGAHGLDPLYKNWLGELMRSLVGPASPRHVNPEAGHSLAQRERTGR